jgi:hypothetical protein
MVLKNALFKLEDISSLPHVVRILHKSTRTEGAGSAPFIMAVCYRGKKWARKKSLSLSVTCQRQAASTTPVAAVWRVEWSVLQNVAVVIAREK